MVFFQHHWIQFFLGKERTGMNGWAKYVRQSGVGYYIACFDCNAPFKVPRSLYFL